MIPYWAYKFICKLCFPFVSLINMIPFFKIAKPNFAVFLLFRNRFQRDFVYSLMCSECGGMSGYYKDYNSSLATKYNNYFGMGSTKSSPYQSGAWNSGKAGEPVFATYSNQYDAVYDFWDWFSRRRQMRDKETGKLVVPADWYFYQFPDNNNWTRAGMNTFISNNVAVLKEFGYFTATLESKVGGMLKYSYDMPYATFKWAYTCSLILPIIVVIVVVWFISWVTKKLVRTKKNYNNVRRAIKKATR